MARIVDGPEITGQVVHKQTGQAYGPVTVTVSPKVYTDREMTASVTSLTTDGTGVFSCYAPPGTYTFTTTAVDSQTIEPVEVLGREGGTGVSSAASLPSQTGNASKVLTTDGSAASWVSEPSLISQFDAELDVGLVPNASGSAAANLTALQAFVTANLTSGQTLVIRYSGKTFYFSGSLTLPALLDAVPTTILHFEGQGPFPAALWAPGTVGHPAPTKGTILRWTAATNYAIGSAPGAFTNVMFSSRRCSYMVPDNPTFDMISAKNFYNLQLEEGYVGTPSATDAIVQPTHGTVGVLCPDNGNGGTVTLKRIGITGFGTGLTHSEHAVLDEVTVLKCNFAFEIWNGYYPARYRSVMGLWCPTYVIPKAANTTPTPVSGDIRFEDTVSAGQWYTTVHHVDDGNDYLRGRLEWTLVVATVGYVHSLLTTGATNLLLQEVYAAASSWVGGGSAAPLASTQYNPGTSTAISTASTTFVDADAVNLAVTFTAPASGNVILTLCGRVNPGTGDYLWAIRDSVGYVTGSGTYVGFGSSVFQRTTTRVKMTGLTPGNSYTWKWAHRVTSGTGTLQSGGDPTAATGIGPSLMEVWAA